MENVNLKKDVLLDYTFVLDASVVCLEKFRKCWMNSTDSLKN